MEKKMDIRDADGNIYIENVADFNLEQTLECGQCFHFEKLSDLEYVVIAFGKLLHIKQVENKLIFFDKDYVEVEKIWIPYFDLERDYSVIKKWLVDNDEKLTDAIKEKYGVRILKQEFYETVISFIISQNKQIPHIKKIVFDLSEKYGECLGEINGKKYYSFPSLDCLKEITEENYRDLKTGFRAPYLVCASEKLASTLTKESMQGISYEEAKKRLTEIKGIGDKVANCILLFGLSYRNAFPVDVWIKRTMEENYFDGRDTSKEKIMEFAKEKYGQYGGYAQQYLFYYGRSKAKDKN